MTCERVKLPGGGAAIVCGRRAAAAALPGEGLRPAGVAAVRFPAHRRQDRYLCRVHAVPQGRGVDYCPDHPLVQGDLFAEHADG